MGHISVGGTCVAHHRGRIHGWSSKYILRSEVQNWLRANATGEAPPDGYTGSNRLHLGVRAPQMQAFVRDWVNAHKNLSYEELEMILVRNHAPFSWRKTPEKAVYNSAVLEAIARMAFITEQVRPDTPRLKDALIRKHYERKHGPHSYYGQ